LIFIKAPRVLALLQNRRPDNTGSIMPPSDSAASQEPGLWRAFAAAPHRMMFLPGVLQAVMVMLFWLAELLGRLGWWPPLPLVLASVFGACVSDAVRAVPVFHFRIPVHGLPALDGRSRSYRPRNTSPSSCCS
jgi:hypothetical protein